MRPPRAACVADPGLGFAYGRMRFFGDWEGELRFPPYDPYALLYRHTIGLSALARREVFDDTGGFDPAFGQFEDWELWVNALAHGWRGRQVDAVTVEYRRHEGSKHAQDRRAYRQAFRQLRAKHVALYLDRDRLAVDSALGPLSRFLHRSFWGPRPVPAILEQGLHRLLWGRKAARPSAKRGIRSGPLPICHADQTRADMRRRSRSQDALERQRGPFDKAPGHERQAISHWE